MIKLFRYEDYEVKIDPEAILLLPFKRIYDRDRSKNKTTATLELGFIYHFCDPRSDYQYITNKEERLGTIKKELGIKNEWKPDKIVRDAMEFYNSFKPISAGLLEDTKDLINRFRIELRNIDFNERDKNDRPVNTLKSIAETIKQIPGLATDLDKAEKALLADITNDSKARGSQSKGLFEDGFE